MSGVLLVSSSSPVKQAQDKLALSVYTFFFNACHRSMDEICSGQWGDAASRSLREFMRALTPFSAPPGRSR